MRNFDNWNSYRDMDGNILRGCVQFNVKGGNTPAPIFDRNFTAISNPQITDIVGRTQNQVFIDSDVTAYFYKYVGIGTLAEEEALGIDVSDVTKWSLQYTCDNTLVLGNSLVSNAAMGVSSMDNLRALDPDAVPLVDGAKIVTLNGYYDCGDCEPVSYIWNSASTDSDDNGSVIKCDDVATGRWILVTPTEHCDSRHFGVFPQVSKLADVDHTTRIGQLVNYCNSHSIRPFFNGTTGIPYFIYNYLNVSSRNTIDVSRGTRFVDKNNSNFYGNFNGDPIFENANTNIRSESIKTSWKFKSATNYKNVLINSDNITQKSYENANVEVTVDIDNFTFDNCVMSSDGHVGNCVFTNCNLAESIFDTSKSPGIDNTDIIDLDNFQSVAFWLKLKGQQSGTMYDMKGRTVDSTCVVTKQGIYWKNALFSSFSYTPGYSCVFDGCTGGMTLDCSNNPAIGVKYSTLDMQWASGLPSVTLSDSTLNNVGTSLSMFSLVASRSSISGNVIYSQGFTLSHCNVTAHCVCTVAYKAEFCDIGEDIDINAAGNISLDLSHNNLSHTLSIASSVADSVVVASIVGNRSIATPAISLDRTNLKALDSYHTYTYSGNSGTFIPERTKPESVTCTVRIFGNFVTDYSAYEGTHRLGRIEGGSGLFVYNKSSFFDSAEFFRIGADAFDVDMRIVKYGMNTVHGVDNNIVCGSATLEASLVSDFTWGLKLHLVDPSDPTSNVSYNANLTTALPAGTAGTEYTKSFELQYENLEKHG